MNLLTHLCWTSYFELVLLLLTIYYGYILFRYYGDDLRRLIQPTPKGDQTSQHLSEALRYQQPEEISHTATDIYTHSNPDNFPDDSMEEADHLISQLKQIITSASGKPFAPAVLIPQLKKSLRENNALQDSPHRPAINELIIAECERTGTALLTEDEVDQWWD